MFFVPFAFLKSVKFPRFPPWPSWKLKQKLNYHKTFWGLLWIYFGATWMRSLGNWHCQPEQAHYGAESTHLLLGYSCCGSSVQIFGVKQSRNPINKSPYVQSRLLRVPWTARRSNQSIIKEISPGCSLEGLMLKLKLQYFGHVMRRVDSLEKTDSGRDWGQEEKGTTEDELAGWHHQVDGHEFGWNPGVGDEQGGLACCSSWGCKELDTTEWLNWTKLLNCRQILFYLSHHWSPFKV